MILEVSGISFAYNSHSILDKVRFTVRPGELVAILGPNGVGKTTLLKCINAIQRPHSGTVMLADADIFSMSPGEIARNIGYVAQRTDTARLTVYDAVLMGRKPHIRWKVSEKDLKMVDAALARLELKHLSLRFVDQLSGGELQKVAVARSLVQEPNLLLMDEPTSSLDLKNQVSILSMIRDVVHGHGVAGIMTMHDLNMALRFADSFLLLKEGKVFAQGRTGSVTPEMVEEVYGLSVQIHELDGFPVVLPRIDSANH